MLSEISQSEKANTIWSHSYVESNEQTELTSKTETDSQIQSRLTAVEEGQGVEGERKKGKKEKTHALG